MLGSVVLLMAAMADRSDVMQLCTLLSSSVLHKLSSKSYKSYPNIDTCVCLVSITNPIYTQNSMSSINISSVELTETNSNESAHFQMCICTSYSHFMLQDGICGRNVVHVKKKNISLSFFLSNRKKCKLITFLL